MPGSRLLEMIKIAGEGKTAGSWEKRGGRPGGGGGLEYKKGGDTRQEF